jgi:hypothetical protein
MEEESVTSEQAAPRTLEEMNAFLKDAPLALNSDAGLAEVLDVMDRMLDVRVIHTREDLHSLTLDQPGPEVIHSGTLGATGLARWEPPRRDSRELVFYANLWKKDGADFACLRVDLATRTLSVEVVDQGWYEVAAYLG